VRYDTPRQPWRMSLARTHQRRPRSVPFSLGPRGRRLTYLLRPSSRRRSKCGVAYSKLTRRILALRQVTVTRKDCVPYNGASRVMNRGIHHPPNKRHDFGESRPRLFRSAQHTLVERRIPGGLVAAEERFARAPSLCCPSPRGGSRGSRRCSPPSQCACVENAFRIRGRFRHSNEHEIERPYGYHLCS
jgi:hypothetical protein